MTNEVALAFRAALEKIIERARAAGLLEVPLDQFSYSWWEQNETGSGRKLCSETKDKTSLQNLFSVIAPGHEELPEIEQLKTATRAFEEGRGMMAIFLMSPGKLLRHYFETEVSRALTIDDAAIERTIDRYTAALTPPFVLKTTLLWSGFTAPAPFSIDDKIQFRPIAPGDYEELGRESPWLRFSVGPRLPYPSSRDWICEIRESVPIQSHGTPVVIIRRLVLSVALIVPGKAEVYTVATEFENVFLRSGHLFNPTPMSTSRLGPPVSLAAQDIDELKKLYARLEQVETVPELGYLGVPLRRLQASSARPTDEDSLVDSVIGLESLLAPDSPNIEVTFRFRLRGATVLDSAFGNPKERLSFLSELYRARSDAVHGKKIENVRDLSIRAEEALKAVFKWFVDRPDATEGAKAIVEKIDTAMSGATVPS